MKLIVSLLSTVLVLSLFSFGQSSNHNDAPIYLKDSTIGNALEGTYVVYVDIHTDEPLFVGHLNLQENVYSFEYERNYAALSETNIPIFIFLEINEGNFSIKFRDNINENTKLSEFSNNQIIGTVSFNGNANKNPVLDAVAELLLRIDTEKNLLYFHSLQNEFQTWSIEKYLETDDNSKNSSEIPDTLQLLLKINDILLVGWGSRYSCDIEEIKKGYLDSNQQTIIISVSVGSEHLLENIHLLETDSEFLITFVNSNKTTDKPYIPAGTTGFVNEKGEIWDIISIKKISDVIYNKDGDIKLYSDNPTVKRAEYFLNHSKIKFRQIQKDPFWNKSELLQNEYYFMSKEDNILLSLFFFEHQKYAKEFAESNFSETNELSKWGVNGPMLFHVDGKDVSNVNYVLGYFSGEE